MSSCIWIDNLNKSLCTASFSASLCFPPCCRTFKNIVVPHIFVFKVRKKKLKGLKNGLQLTTNTEDGGWCSPPLPLPSRLPFKRSDYHENPQRPSVPPLYPALTAAALLYNTHIRHLFHTNALLECLPFSLEHLEVKKISLLGYKKKKKQEATKYG